MNYDNGLTLMRYKCVMFDFGGTLVDTSPLERDIHVCHNLLRWRALGFNGSMKEYMKAVKRAEAMHEKHKADAAGKPEIWSMTVGQSLGIKITKKQALADFKGFMDYCMRTFKLYPHAKEILRYIKGHKLKLVLISNGWTKDVHAQLKRLGISKYFDLIIVSEKVGAEKSELKPFRIALQKIKLRPEDCLMVGDRLDEDAYAKKLGIDVCWMLSRPKFKHPKAIEKFDYKIRDLSELKNIINGTRTD